MKYGNAVNSRIKYLQQLNIISNAQSLKYEGKVTFLHFHGSYLYSFHRSSVPRIVIPKASINKNIMILRYVINYSVSIKTFVEHVSKAHIENKRKNNSII